MGKSKTDSHARNTVVWTMVGSLAAAAGVVVAIIALKDSPASPAVNQNTASPTFSPVISPNITVNAGNPNATVVSPLTSAENPVGINRPATNAAPTRPAQEMPTFSEAEQKLLEQANDAVTNAKLQPFLAAIRITLPTGDAIENQPSYSKLEPMMTPDLVGLNTIYLFLRQNTNGNGEAWIPEATGPRVIQGVSPGLAIPIDWLNDEKTKLILTNRQQLLLKFAPVLLKAGKLKP